MQLDVIIQDPYFTGDQPSAMPIPPETWEEWFQIWLRSLAATLPPAQGYEVCVRLTDDAEIQSLNAQYRQKNQPTDVLAFAALEADYPQVSSQDEDTDESLYLGDIVISVETARDQASERGHSLKEELAWLSTHGLLHLLGWDHPDEASLMRMLSQQQDLLKAIALQIHYE